MSHTHTVLAPAGGAPIERECADSTCLGVLTEEQTRCARGHSLVRFAACPRCEVDELATAVDRLRTEMEVSRFDREHIGEILADPAHLRFDHFSALLFHVIAKADPHSRQRIRLGFPEHVAVYERWFATGQTTAEPEGDVLSDHLAASGVPSDEPPYVPHP
jgi:hypothetical protein